MKNLKEIDKLKAAFVANVAHVFKNPLAIINESISLLLDETAGGINQKQKDLLERGRAGTERLIRMVTDLARLSEIEAGKTGLKRERIDMVSLVSDALTDSEGIIAKKRIRLKRRIPKKAIFIWADRDRLKEAIANLLSYAVKYTPSEGEIDIKLKVTKRDVSFESSDTGPGIPKGRLQAIFDKFGIIMDEKDDGTGLGLPIAKNIIELHKGKIWAKNAPGKGARFFFTLPCDLRMSPRYSFRKNSPSG